MMEKVEIAVRVLGVGYALGICGMILRLQGESTSEHGEPVPPLQRLTLVVTVDYIMLVTVFTMVFTCPCLWAIIRFCRDYAARRRMVVLPEKKAKKRPDIAVASGKAVQRTQAEILAEQRERVKNLHGVGEKKLKPKAPKRKGPPSKKN